MDSIGRRCLLRAFAVAAILALPLPATAQTIDQVMAGTPESGERFGIGLVGGAGMPGPLFGVRASVPASPRAGIDFDVAFADVGRIVSGQLRWLWRGRKADGPSPHFVVGLAYFRGTSRSEIRWPDGTRTVTESIYSKVAPQFGVGLDVLTDRGGRIGAQVTTGGSSQAGPLMHARLFVVFGP